MAKLPPPEQWVFAPMDEMQLAEMIEEHVDFNDDADRSVHLPTQFVRHYLQRHDSPLPTAVTVATLPIVLADGTLLAPDGLDRSRGIIFEIQKEVRAALPRREECIDEAVRAAMHFLCDDWLFDVKAGYADKCTAIAAALTIIERSLLPDRPAFFVTAGRRGGGKTTLVIMLIMAATGIRPAASAWSPNEEERRKALLLSLHVWGALHSLGQHPARHPNQLPAHRAFVHVCLLFRPQARRQRNGGDGSLGHPLLFRQQYRPARRSRIAQSLHPHHRGPARPGKPEIHTCRSRSVGQRTTAPKSCGRSTRSCSAIRLSRRRTTRRRKRGSRHGGG